MTDGSPPAPVTFRGVLGRAADILRRHGTTFALLALAFSTVPSFLLYASSEPVRRAIVPDVDKLDVELFAFGVYGAYIVGCALTRGLALAGDVAIVLVGPGPVALWAGIVAVQSVAAAFGTAIDVLMTALYRELHGRERARSSTLVVEAFE